MLEAVCNEDYMGELRRGLQPFFCFYGGKWRAAPKYAPPAHGIIVEPFAGAAGYSTRYPDRQVILVERDEQIAALWTWLVTVSAHEVRSLPLLRADQTLDDLPHLIPEAQSLIGFWLNKGSATPKRTPSAWMRAGIRPKSFWGVEVRERIAQQVDYIRHWHVIHGDFTKAPDAEATWFVDPPYQVAGRRYRYSELDYPWVGEWVRGRRGQVIACENEGADWLPFVPFADLKANESKHGGKRSSEVVWTNEAAEVRRSVA